MSGSANHENGKNINRANWDGTERAYGDGFQVFLTCTGVQMCISGVYDELGVVTTSRCYPRKIRKKYYHEDLHYLLSYSRTI